MDYSILNKIEQLDKLNTLSNIRLQIIFKHSTRCSVSSMVKRALDMDLKQGHTDTFDIYYLDLLAYRQLSNQIALRYNIRHESPQLLVIKEGSCIFHASHEEVSLMEALMHK